MELTAEVRELVEFYKLEPHPEGGFYRRTYCAEGLIQQSTQQMRFKGERHYSTAIYYLLPAGNRSKLHRIASDEVWHFYLGGPITIAEISPKDGKVKLTSLGNDFRKGQVFQHVVPAGSWFGSYPQEGTAFALVGCTVSPGFDFADFEIGDKDKLLKEFPNAKEVIDRLL